MNAALRAVLNLIAPYLRQDTGWHRQSPNYLDQRRLVGCETCAAQNAMPFRSLSASVFENHITLGISTVTEAKRMAKFVDRFGGGTFEEQGVRIPT